MRGILCVAALALLPTPLAAEEADKPVGELLIECAPTEYAAAIDCLETHLSEESLVTLKEDGPALAHFGLGMWIRNNWGLWAGGPLGQSMNKMGFLHPDDMSGVILGGLVARLRGEEYDLEERIAFYKSYWEGVSEQEPPEPMERQEGGETQSKNIELPAQTETDAAASEPASEKN
ncbi:MAG: DUF6794 domain-containing protein [Pseudomonadota bacterium]